MLLSSFVKFNVYGCFSMTKIEINSIKKSLADKIKIYKELTEITMEDLVEELLEDFFDKIRLTDGYIRIDEIYYFNFTELLKNKEVKATKNKLYVNLNETFIIKKIPNNLDKFDKNYNIFCYGGNPEKHVGVYSYNRFYCESKFKDTELFQYYILFEYNEKTEELILRLTDLNDIKLRIDLNILPNILNELNESNQMFIEELDRIKNMPEEKKLILEYSKPLFEFDNPLFYMHSSTVIESFINAKKMAESFHRIDFEGYEELRGKYGSEDLVILREGRLLKKDEIEELKKSKELNSSDEV